MKDIGVGVLWLTSFFLPSKFRQFPCELCSSALSFSPLLLSSKRRSSVEPIPPCIPDPKEPHAIVATQSHPQHGLLQAHSLVAISAGHAPHLFLRRVPRRHVRRNHARHAAVHH